MNSQTNVELHIERLIVDCSESGDGALLTSSLQNQLFQAIEETLHRDASPHVGGLDTQSIAGAIATHVQESFRENNQSSVGPER